MTDLTCAVEDQLSLHVVSKLLINRSFGIERSLSLAERRSLSQATSYTVQEITAYCIRHNTVNKDFNIILWKLPT